MNKNYTYLIKQKKKKIIAKKNNLYSYFKLDLILKTNKKIKFYNFTSFFLKKKYDCKTTIRRLFIKMGDFFYSLAKALLYA